MNGLHANPATSKARTKIRQAVNEARVTKAEIAKEMLQRRFKIRKIDVDEGKMAKLLNKMGYKVASDFYVALSEGKLDVNDIVDQYLDLCAKLLEAATGTGTTHETAENFVLQTPTADGTENDDILVIGNDVRSINQQL